ncbi:hypothetical protein OC835_001661 [Tilletia horrida]|nr:hypothetical protein OC835_001661 [Tilletia horrida]
MTDSAAEKTLQQQQQQQQQQQLMNGNDEHHEHEHGHLDGDDGGAPESELPPQDSKEASSEQGKIRTLLSVLRKFVGVKDLASQRFSLPANLLHPQANLDYWCYFDRPDLFAVIPEMEDPLDRMLAVVRYAFSKELKFYDGKIVKPFNSVLGEHFRCHWELALPMFDPKQGGLVPVEGLRQETAKPLPVPSLRAKAAAAGAEANGSKNSSVNGHASTDSNNTTAKKGLSRLLSTRKGTSSTSSHTSAPNGDASAVSSEAQTRSGPSSSASSISSAGASTAVAAAHLTQRNERKVVQLVEQTSHHPPISCFMVVTDGIEAYGVDQLSARFTGSSVKIGPGQFAKGVFLKLKEGAKGGSEGEEYQATHATASLNGILRGSLWLSVADQSYITCRGGSRAGPRLRAIIEYKDESWVGRAKYALQGIIYEYDPETEGEDIKEKHRKIADVKPERVRVHIAGSWKGLITYELVAAPDAPAPALAGPQTLIDMADLVPLPKQVRPLEEHEPLESRRVWSKVIDAIHAKDFSRATKEKQIVEQRQRDEAAERKKNNVEHEPQFFEKEYSDGRPTLTQKGREVIDGMLRSAA